MELFFSTFLKMFFIMTPFFVLSVFLTVTKEATEKEKHTLAVKVTISVIITCLILLFFGQHIFSIFGITLDAFRIGAGALLFLTAVDLIRGTKDGQKVDASNLNELAVVPLALPIIIGPGAIGVLMVFGAGFQTASQMFVGSLGIVFAVIVVGIMLYFSNIINKAVGKQGLQIISKIIGLFLAALSAQIVFTGIKNFLSL
ncbi:MarC family protein [Arcobacter sp. LA11]|uniref:MarC family protein n=1 Tax=Arcobacter sp. LA11 TaxID=1898176 RepID=UPI00093295D0|nr:MarC family protein [Arcobacter sp. LA11]